jgi:lipopolysaccharide export system ATP-binding protein
MMSKLKKHDTNIILEVKNLGKLYGEKRVVRDVSLSVERGQVVGLFGPNGAGKTTCFYAIIGMVASDFGSVLFDGKDVTEMPMV